MISVRQTRLSSILVHDGYIIFPVGVIFRCTVAVPSVNTTMPAYSIIWPKKVTTLTIIADNDYYFIFLMFHSELK